MKIAALAISLICTAFAARADIVVPARLSSRMTDFALTTCEPRLQCYRIEAKVARPSLTGSADLVDLHVLILDLAGVKVLKDFTAKEGFYDSRTRTLVARKVDLPGVSDAFLSLGTGSLKFFQR